LNASSRACVAASAVGTVVGRDNTNRDRALVSINKVGAGVPANVAERVIRLADDDDEDDDDDDEESLAEGLEVAVPVGVVDGADGELPLERADDEASVDESDDEAPANEPDVGVALDVEELDVVAVPVAVDVVAVVVVVDVDVVVVAVLVEAISVADVLLDGVGLGAGVISSKIGENVTLFPERPVPRRSCVDRIGVCRLGDVGGYPRLP